MSSEISPLLKNLPAPALVTFKGDGFIADPLSKQASGKMTLAKKFWGVTVTVNQDLSLEAKETEGRIKNVFTRFALYFFAVLSYHWNKSYVNSLNGHNRYYFYTKHFSAEDKLQYAIKNTEQIKIKLMQLIYKENNFPQVMKELNKIEKVQTRVEFIRDIIDERDTEYADHLKVVETMFTKNAGDVVKELHKIDDLEKRIKLINDVYDPNNKKPTYLLRERGFAFYDNGNQPKAKDDIAAYKKIMHQSETKKSQYHYLDAKVKEKIEQILNDSIQN